MHVLLDLPGLPEVIDEFLTIVEGVDERGEHRLEELIADGAYRRNALMLARRIAPDGTNIRQVGFATSGVAGSRVVGFTRVGRDVLRATPLAGESPEQVEIQGTLLFADARNDGNEISIVSDDGVEQKVRVSPEAMDDIVPPMWNSAVVVRGVREGNFVKLVEIDSAGE